MKTNAIVRIVIYSIVILLLTGLLVAGLGFDAYTFQTGSGSGEYLEGNEGTADAAQVKNLDIDWAAGSITIVSADTDAITFSEAFTGGTAEVMVFDVRGDTLHLEYTKTSMWIGGVSLPSKDLTITVPRDWICGELEIDGAALDVEVQAVSIGTLDIDGADCEVRLTGSVDTVECDGAACTLELNCTGRPRSIDIDGADCELELTLPEGCGFRVEMNGLSCDFTSSLPCTQSGGVTTYGDGFTDITADGIACDITVRSAAAE